MVFIQLIPLDQVFPAQIDP